MGLIEILLAGFALATVGGAVAAGLIDRRIADSAWLIERSGLRLGELRRLENAQRLAAAQFLAEGAVEGGTRVVQVVHHGIAGIPFGILGAIPVTRAPARAARKAHDLIAEGVYGAISAVNRGIGRLLRGSRKIPEDGKP